MSEQPDPQRLAALENRIDALKKTQEETPPMESHHSMASAAWRMVTELVAGLAIGFGVGWGLDTALGTTPFLMVLFVLLGFVAGVRVMIRTAQEIQEQRIMAEKSVPETQADITATETTRK
ncbi:AtpZ/AtpI family protein [Halocynthiibacter namhaensis]|uniref:AtpZ/AtpI family protein n=1 Tax=Halocynthiibacter namhaensis TaxID=1290553 RepID=UPI000578EB9D|nr:AtpZ/AtpI family protein [Halocynthiibacter namhaensis]